MTTAPGDAVVPRASWQWIGWPQWVVTPSVLLVALVAVVLDVASAWAEAPDWYFGRILVSPALPLAALLLLLVGGRRGGGRRAGVESWREFLVVTGLGIVVVALVYARAVGGWGDVGGVLVGAAGEEVVYRLCAVLVFGAGWARLLGRNWRDTSAWGSGPVLGGLLCAAVLFSALPGHVQQMEGVATVVPFASLAMLLGYATWRTGSLLPAVAVHALLDLAALAFFAGSITASERLGVAAAALVALMVAMMPAGRRLGLRRRVPVTVRAGADAGPARRRGGDSVLIDLRAPEHPVIDLRDDAVGAVDRGPVEVVAEG